MTTALAVQSNKFTLSKVRQFIENPVETFLSKEEAVCFVLWALSIEDQYATGLLNLLKTEYRCLKLSDTVLYAAIKCLEESPATIERYQGEKKHRGRPSEMFKLNVPQEEVQRYIDYWIVNFGDFKKTK